MTAYTLHHGDCLDVLRTMEDCSVDAIVTDPPYGLTNTDPDKVTETIVRWAQGDREYVPQGRGFMSQTWDAFVPPPAVWGECIRVLKPGGHLVAFAGSRTQDLMGLAIRLAGFDLRDSVAWLYGSGFPKSLDVGKKLGEEWAGWGTALKPGHEPIILARKPFSGTVAGNVQEHGTGALNIDATRLSPLAEKEVARSGKSTNGGVYGKFDSVDWKTDSKEHAGRWPANVILDEDQAHALDEQSGNRPGFKSQRDLKSTASNYFGADKHPGERDGYGDQGGASRFFYVAKAGKKERPSYVDENGDIVAHPTVKPVALMRWLVRLVTPPGGTVLDPFAGSGTTGEAAAREGMVSILVENHAPFIPLIHQRMDRVSMVPLTLI